MENVEAVIALARNEMASLRAREILLHTGQEKYDINQRIIATQNQLTELYKWRNYLRTQGRSYRNMEYFAKPS